MWQTKLGKCIYISPSGYKVYQNFFYRWLTLGSTALQTVISKRNLQKPVLYYLMPLTLLARALPSDCCLLGLGGGGAVHLMNTYAPGLELIAIENSEEIISIAKQFFMIEQIDSLKVVHMNAKDYLRENKKEFKHVLVDLYDANNFPDECNTDEFFNACKNTLSPDGFLTVNLANSKEQWPVVQLIKNQFPNNTLVIPIKKSANIVVFASKNEKNGFLADKIKELPEIKRIVWDGLWGYIGEY